MKIFVANHKNYMDNDEMIKYINHFKKYEQRKNIIICPSSIYLSMFKETFLNIGSQDFDLKCPMNGGISLKQLTSLKIKYIIIGHSDNKKYKNEDSKLINKKLLKSLEKGFVPILCIGEDINNINDSMNIIKKQIDEFLEDINYSLLKKIIFAYEPVWAISDGINKVDVSQNINLKDIIKSIKLYLNEKYNLDSLVLYGGSVNKYNIDSLNDIDEIGGYLIGKSSTSIDEFDYIINS
mgnify:CR=1 FL=1